MPSGQPARCRSARLTPFVIAAAAGAFTCWTVAQFAVQQRQLLLPADLAIHFQALLNTLDGRFLQYSLESQWTGGGSMCYLGSHVSLIQLIYLPLLLIWRHPAALIAGQAALLAAGALFAAGLARLRCPASAAAPAAFAVVYLGSPLLLTQAHVFHPEALAVPAAAMLFYFHARASARGMAAAALLLALCREEFCLFVALFALLFLVPDPRFRRLGAVLAAAGLAWFAVDLALVLPHFAGQRVHLWRYRHLAGALDNPASAFAASNLRLFPRFFLFVLLPYLCLPLLRPRWLALAAAMLVPVALSSNADDATFLRHYALPAALPLLAGACEVVGAAPRRWRRSLPLALAAWAVLLNGVDYNSLHRFGYLLPNPAAPWRAVNRPSYLSADAEAALQQPGTVSAAVTLIALARAHTAVYPFPVNWRDADVIVLDDRSSYYPLGREAATAAIGELERDPRFELQARAAPLAIFQRRR